MQNQPTTKNITSIIRNTESPKEEGSRVTLKDLYIPKKPILKYKDTIVYHYFFNYKPR